MSYHAWLPNVGVGIPPCDFAQANFESVLLDDALRQRFGEALPGQYSLEPGLRLFIRAFIYYGVQDGEEEIPPRTHLAYLLNNPTVGPKYLFISEPVSEDNLKNNTIQKFYTLPLPLMGGLIVTTPINIRSGLLAFEIFLNEDYYAEDEEEEFENELAGQLFRLLRRCYHRHVWTDGDLVAEPVQNCTGLVQAADAIWESTFQKRLFADTTCGLKRAYFTTNRPGEKHWITVKQTCAAAIGELAYAETLANHTSDPAAHKEACRLGRETYQNIWNLILAKQSGLAQSWTKAGLLIAFLAWLVVVVNFGIEDVTKLVEHLNLQKPGLPWEAITELTFMLFTLIWGIVIIKGNAFISKSLRRDYTIPESPW